MRSRQHERAQRAKHGCSFLLLERRLNSREQKGDQIRRGAVRSESRAVSTGAAAAVAAGLAVRPKAASMAPLSASTMAAFASSGCMALAKSTVLPEQSLGAGAGALSLSQQS